MKTPWTVAVFLLFILSGVDISVSRGSSHGTLGVFGGPAAVQEGVSPFSSAIALANVNPALGGSDVAQETHGASYALASIEDPGSSFGDAKDLAKYTVRKGDTFSKIAKMYGLSVKDLKRQNPSYTALRPGNRLLIASQPPLSHTALASALPPQSQTAAPAASPSSNALLTRKESSAYFIEPTAGFNWGKLHNYNAVDIANSCGTPLYAAADGIVVPDDSLGDGVGGWNSGYGNFVLIEHPNGVKTRYAHMERIDVPVGSYVKQGEKIGEMGNTGNTTGITGCHLHFEVIGAPNPFAR